MVQTTLAFLIEKLADFGVPNYLHYFNVLMCFFFGSTSDKEPTCQFRRCKRHGFSPCVRKIPSRRAWKSTQVFLPGESYGQRSLVGYSP